MSSKGNTRPNNIRSQESSLCNSLPIASPIESMASNSSIVCHKCHHKGHIASRCPQRALALDVEHSSLEDEEDQIVDPLDYSGDEDDLHEDCDDEACVGVVRCVLSTTVDNDNWKRTIIFHTIIQNGYKKCKLVIDGGSSMNVVSKDTVKLLNLKVEPHPNPFRSAWVIDHTLPITQRCLVSIQMGDYKDEIYYNVLPMDIAHVLLGRPWLYDLNVTNFGKDNIYSFKYKGKNIILRPAKPKGCNGNRDISKLPERNLHILKCKKFERKGIGTGMCITLVAKEVPSVSLPPHMCVSEPAKNFAKHIHDLHAEIRQKISLSNEEYKLVVDVHRRSKEFNVGDYVIVRIRPERIPKMFSKKLYARAMGPYSIIHKMRSNAYLLDLPNDMDISPVFNVKDLLPYRGTFEPSTLPYSVSAGAASKGAPTMPSLQYSKETVDIILDDEFVTSREGGFRRFLVKWHGRLDSDATWIQEDDLPHLDPSLLDCYLSYHSSESSSFQPGGNDRAWSRPISRSKRDRKPKSNDEFYYY